MKTQRIQARVAPRVALLLLSLSATMAGAATIDTTPGVTLNFDNPANEYTGPDWVTQFPDTDIPADGAFPEFDTIEQVRHYIDTHERVTAE